jgi:hypothetical protein
MVSAGNEALARAAWADARAHFEAALAARESAEALLGLGLAARAQLDAVTTLEAHEPDFRAPGPPAPSGWRRDSRSSSRWTRSTSAGRPRFAAG